MLGSGKCSWKEVTSCKYHNRAFSKMADHFDEKSGVVPSKTSWGNWAQTIDEVFIEVDVPKGTKGREISCDIKPKSIKFCLKGREFFKVTQSVIMIYSFSIVFGHRIVLINRSSRFYGFIHRESSLELFWLMKVLGF